jgi:hypothetical protein
MSILVEKDESEKEGTVERPTEEAKSTETPKGRMYYVYDICRWPW